MEGDTDTLGRAIMRHERDARRIQAVLDGSSKPFSRALPRVPMSQRLQRYSAAEQKEVAQRLESRTTTEARDSEVVTSTTRSRGRKQRPERHWTRHDIPVVQEQALQSSHGVQPRQTTSADQEEDDVIVLPHRTAYTGDDRRGEHGALGDDTPPSMARLRHLAEPSSMRHMNSSILGDAPNDVSPIRQSRYHALSSRTTDSQRSALDTNKIAPTKSTSNRRTINLRHGFHDDKENLFESKSQAQPTNESRDIPEIMYDIQERSEKQSNGSLQDQATTSSGRTNSVQLLKLLAKVTSNSPSRQTERQAAHASHDTNPSQPQRSSEGDGQVAARIMNLQEMPATPVITGGWVDTPKHESKTSIAKEANIEPGQAADRVRQSDLKAEPVSSIPQESLQSQSRHTSSVQQSVSAELVHRDAQKTNPVAPETRDQPYDGIGRHLNLGQLKQASQPVSPRRSALQSALAQPSSQRERSQAALKSTKRVAFDLDGRTVCEHCGGGYTNVWEALWVELRRNFYLRDADALAGVRLTWLGAVLLAWLCWYMLERSLCRTYCKPFYARQMDSYGAYPLAPKYPLVIPDLLLRPFEPLWLPVAKWLGWLSAATFHWIFGEGAREYTKPAHLSGQVLPLTALQERVVQMTGTVGSARWAEAASTVASASTRRALASVIDAIDDLGRMQGLG